MDWVDVPGPPFVMATTWSKTPRKFLNESMTFIVKNGMMSGKVILLNFLQPTAPSTEAAS